jgi:dihydroorotate dehydrogenase electron transfer subunit
VKTALLTVVENTRLYGNTYCMWFDAPELMHGAAPGRFLMLRCADAAQDGSVPFDPLLPRAMSYSTVRKGKNGDEFSILYDVVGRGTAWLAARNAGDKVFGWGPLGKGYSLRGDGQNLLLVGGGIGIAPLVWLAEEAVSKGKSVVVLDGARDASGVYPAEMWPDEVELVVTTQDGSAGRKGLVTDVFLDYFEWSDTVFTCGPNPMFAALADVLRSSEGSQRARRRKPVQALLESPMGCGTGICYGCAVFDRRGAPRLVCKEGPRFELRDIW